MRLGVWLGVFLSVSLLCVEGMVPLCRSEDLTDLGGALSTDLPGRHAIQATAPNVTDSEKVTAQTSGFPLFHRITTRKDGLGPSFANASCAGCHINNGKGPATFGVPSRHGSSMVVKVKPRGLLPDGSAPELPRIGGQLLDQSVSKPIKRTVSVTWTNVPGRYPDGTKYTLRKPTLYIPTAFKLPRGTISSLRMSPPMIGMGLLEAIPAMTIARWSDPQDADGDGVSGRVNWVKDLTEGGYKVGRFGFKATHPTVVQQTASALYHDMNITNPLFGAEKTPAETPLETLHSIAVYLRLAGVPKARTQAVPSAITGQQIFRRLRCDSCHKMSVRTGIHSDQELSNQTIHPFTDLLLHDMGRELADTWSEFSANGREWRTAPLWGLGFGRQLSSSKPVYLHDGRARSIEEAILWHGGEAAASQKAFKALPKSDRRAILDFLNSL
ncbi:MAG: hypothetical protein RIS36_170 [Pseudomonadota bacterium]